MSTGKSTIHEIATKFMNIFMAAGVDFDAFISTESDSYRKPGTKMWEVMMKGTTIDLKFFHK